MSQLELRGGGGEGPGSPAATGWPDAPPASDTDAASPEHAEDPTQQQSHVASEEKEAQAGLVAEARPREEVVGQKRSREGSAGDAGPSKMVEMVGPPKPACAACKFLRRRCHPQCLYAKYFPPEQPLRFANVHRVFGASNVQKLLLELPEVQREDAVNTLVYEADARIKDPIYGCVGIIRILQQQIAQLHAELAAAHAQLAATRQPQQVHVPQSLGSQPPTPGPTTPLQPADQHAILTAALYGTGVTGNMGTLAAASNPVAGTSMSLGGGLQGLGGAALGGGLGGGSTGGLESASTALGYFLRHGGLPGDGGSMGANRSSAQ